MADEKYTKEELEDTSTAMWEHLEENGYFSYNDDDEVVDAKEWEATCEKVSILLLEQSYKIHNKLKKQKRKPTYAGEAEGD